MNIIIPMAGQGKRFIESGFSIPKPLIKVGSKAMYRHAIDSLPLNMATKLIFIVRKNIYLNQLIDDIEEFYNAYNYKVVVLDQDTLGQAETVLKSAPEIDYSLPTLIHNCDTFFYPTLSYENLLTADLDAAMVLFPSNDIRWSYAKLNEDKSQVIDVREKKVISPYASTGTYFFKDSKILIDNIRNIIKLNIKENNEYYLSGVYRLLIEQKKNIVPLHVNKIFCFGTPQDLVDSLNEILCHRVSKAYEND